MFLHHRMVSWYLFLFGCSSGRYHIDTTNVTAGIRSDSQPPRRNLQTNKPPKLVHAAMHISRTPQQRTLKAKNGTAGILSQSDIESELNFSEESMSHFCKQKAKGPMKANPPKNGADPTHE